MQCSFHTSHAYDLEFVSKQKLFLTVLYMFLIPYKIFCQVFYIELCYVVKIGTGGGKIGQEKFFCLGFCFVLHNDSDSN